MPLRLAPVGVLLVAVVLGCGSGPRETDPDRTSIGGESTTAGSALAVDGEQPLAPDEIAPPTGVRLPTIALDAAVVPVGVDDRGEMEVPRDVRTVGWYRFGARAGAGRGSVVLAGHVDDREQGRGAFYRLVELEVGDALEARRADGTAVGYRVHSVERVAKADLPVERLFARDGQEVLTLITCGGDFDPRLRSYRENVVVTAHRTG